jgi:hypothetical protein
MTRWITCFIDLAAIQIDTWYAVAWTRQSDHKVCFEMPRNLKMANMFYDKQYDVENM